jgi:hypothetical protein
MQNLEWTQEVRSGEYISEFIMFSRENGSSLEKSLDNAAATPYAVLKQLQNVLDPKIPTHITSWSCCPNFPSPDLCTASTHR